jgi:hypothetical protein
VLETHEERREVDDVRELSGELDHALAARGDEDGQVGAVRLEVELRALDADDLAAIGHLLAAEHATADGYRVAHRVHRVRALVRPERRLLESAAEAEHHTTA